MAGPNDLVGKMTKRQLIQELQPWFLSTSLGIPPLATPGPAGQGANAGAMVGGTDTGGRMTFSTIASLVNGMGGKVTIQSAADGTVVLTSANQVITISVANPVPTGVTWTAGTAAPSSVQPVGSLYSRIGGSVGATLYVSRGGGTWAAVAGV